LTAPITLPPLDEQTLTKLRHGYEAASDAETRTRYQMLLFSAKGHTSTQIAELVLRSQDTVVRVLKRFLSGGLEAVPRRSAPGRERTITSAWESELLRVIELDPHEMGHSDVGVTKMYLEDFNSTEARREHTSFSPVESIELKKSQKRRKRQGKQILRDNT
jgi:transposase